MHQWLHIFGEGGSVTCDMENNFRSIGFNVINQEEKLGFFCCLMEAYQLGMLLSVQRYGTIFKKNKSPLKGRYYFSIRPEEMRKFLNKDSPLSDRD
jgi:hypothetical protein